MANGYFDTGDYQELTRLTLARAEAVNAIFDAIINGFDKLPTEAELKEDRVTYAVLADGPVNYTVNLPYDPASYTAGLTVKGKVNVTNTGAATLNVYDRNGVLLGAVAIKRLDGSDLEAGDMPANAVVPLIYNGTEFRLTGAPQGIIATAQSYATAAAASAAAAQTAKNNAETAETNAEAAYDSFRGVYYGALASDPATDPLSNPIDEGDWYYNTTTKRARIYTGAMWSDIGVASLNQYKFTASGGETEVSGQDDNGNTLSYNPDFVWVFKNGVRLINGGEDYTASNGTSITFTVALSGSDEILIDAFSPFTITNALDKLQNLADLPNKATARSNLGIRPPSNRNLLIDAEGRSNQKGNTTATDGNYGHDMWYALTQTAALTLSTLTDVQDGIPSMIRLTQGQATAQRIGYAQVLRSADCKHLRGGSATLSGKIRCSASQAIRYAILGWTGTADSVTKDVVNDWTSSTYTAGNFFVASNVAVLGVGSITPAANTVTDITALTASLGSSFNNLIVFIWSEGTLAQNATLDFRLQLEAGSYATEFESRDDRTLVCQKYFERFGENMFVGSGRADSPTVVFTILTYGRKWRAPSISFTGSNFRISQQGTDATVAAGNMAVNAGIEASRAQVNATATNFTAGEATILYTGSSTYIDVDARL